MQRTVLVVVDEDERRNRISSWLEAAGYDVEVCPGPHAPDYSCLMARRGRCPLVDAAPIAVLDMRLASDDAIQGTPAWHLLTHYLARGVGVIAMTDPGDPVRPFPEADVLVVRRSIGRDAFLESLRIFESRRAGAPASPHRQIGVS